MQKIAIFVVPLDAGIGPRLTMQQLGVPEGTEATPGTGWSVIGHIPSAPTCLVRICGDADALATLADDPDYSFVQEIVEETSNA